MRARTWFSSKEVVSLYNIFLLVLADGRLFSRYCDQPAQYGPYLVSKTELYLPDVLDESNPRAAVLIPRRRLRLFPWSSNNEQKFPLLIYAHGFFGGDAKTYLRHTAILRGMASFGFVVIAPRGCDLDCEGEKSGSTYYLEMLNLIEWVRDNQKNMDSTASLRQCRILDLIDDSFGIGLVGHSMGGNATVMAANRQNPELHKIEAAVILHPGPYNSTFYGKLNIKIPMAVFTSTEDECCGENSTLPIYNSLSPPKAYANMIDAKHTEPTLYYTKWTAYVAAWFQIFIVGNTTSYNQGYFNYDYYYNLIFGDQKDSLCGEAIPMTDNCEAIQV